jgi:sterol desaturase/sphingolipid hydroxylase (fatty acid hydroxylase superfamily)
MLQAIYNFAEELWNGTQLWLFEAAVQPVLLWLGLAGWLEDAYRGVELIMLGAAQVLVILLLFRPLEALMPAEPWPDRRFTRVDIAYTLLNKLGVLPLAVFIALQPLVDVLDETVRSAGMLPPRVEHLFPSLINQHLVTFLIYFALYDFAGYWVHRAQHRFRWWWALHSIHHSQRQMSCWTDDRNHVLDDLIVGAMMAVFAVLVGVQPTEFVGILVASRLLESFSHVNAAIGFGRIGEKLLVSPRYHRLHHALANKEEPHIHDHNYAAVLPIWDILFGTAIFERDRLRPTGVDDAEVDRDNGRGWIGQQAAGLVRFVRAMLPLPQRLRAARY